MAPEKKRVDEDWKRRAEEEKAKIEAALRVDRGEAPEAEEGAAPTAPRPSRPIEGVAGPPRVDFLSLIKPLAMQAMAGLGQMPDPRTGMRSLDLEFARDHIDLLSILQEKTRGNLSAEEQATLEQLLLDLRAGFATMSRAAAEQAMPPEPPGL